MATNENPNFGGGGSSTSTGPIVRTPEYVPTFEEWWNSPEGADARSAIGKMPSSMQADLISQIQEKYERSAQVQNAMALQDTVPQVIEDSKIGQDDINLYEYGEDYNLDDVEAAIYDPRNTVRDTTGRDAQLDVVGIYDDILEGGGKDAVSEAYFKEKRAMAEQAARAQREAAMQNLEEQGRATGGAGIMAELMAASDLQRDASSAALGSHAMAQERRDNIAGKKASLGGDIQGGDDSWGKWYSGELSSHGDKVGKVREAEASTNYGRRTDVDDKNVGLQNKYMEYNKGLPVEGFRLFAGANSDVRDERGGVISELDKNNTANENEPGVGDYLEKGLDIASKVKSIGWSDDDDDDEDEDEED